MNKPTPHPRYRQVVPDADPIRINTSMPEVEDWMRRAFDGAGHWLNMARISASAGNAYIAAQEAAAAASEFRRVAKVNEALNLINNIVNPTPMRDRRKPKA